MKGWGVDSTFAPKPLSPSRLPLSVWFWLGVGLGMSIGLGVDTLSIAYDSRVDGSMRPHARTYAYARPVMGHPYAYDRLVS